MEKMLMLKILGICRVFLTIGRRFRFGYGGFWSLVSGDIYSLLSFHRASACEANEPSNEERRRLRYGDFYYAGREPFEG